MARCVRLSELCLSLVSFPFPVFFLPAIGQESGWAFTFQMDKLKETIMKHNTLFVLAIVFLVSCTAQAAPTATISDNACHITKPVWDKPPNDSAVQDAPEYGYYFLNEDRSIWASAWWANQDENYLHSNKGEIKVGWFRPAGSELVITGQRIDAQAPPLEAHIPCCYPTRFQATSLFFPTEGCWEVTAKAADSVLSFTLWVEP